MKLTFLLNVGLPNLNRSKNRVLKVGFLGSRMPDIIWKSIIRVNSAEAAAEAWLIFGNALVN